MNNLTPAGQNAISDLSQRYGISQDAVLHMLHAVLNGNGTMAQFNHPELGGGGQWMQGGMTMVGDMFNNQLQAKVSNLCYELSNLIATQQVLQPKQYLVGGQMQNNWYPDDLGVPSSSGAQNNMRYAYFAGSCRLAVEENGTLKVYNTLDHQIGGVSQQQSGGQSLSFSSQYGTVNLLDLPLISVNGQAPAPAPAPTYGVEPAVQQQYAEPALVRGSLAESDVFAAIEKLGQLREKGFLSDGEFQQKKSELLSRL